MTNQLSGELGRLLDLYDERRRSEKERVLRLKTDGEAFLNAFADLRRNVIRPVFEQAGEVLKLRGHSFAVIQEEYACDAAGKTTEASISLRIKPSGSTRLDDELPSLCIATRHYNKTVWINSGEAPRAGGLAGAAGAFALDKVTRQLVEDEMIAFVARVVAS